MKASPVRPGDYLEFFAEIDLLGCMSACPSGDASGNTLAERARGALVGRLSRGAGAARRRSRREGGVLRSAGIVCAALVLGVVVDGDGGVKQRPVYADECLTRGSEGKLRIAMPGEACLPIFAEARRRAAAEARAARQRRNQQALESWTAPPPVPVRSGRVMTSDDIE
jgi:hypothetical protein